MIESEQRVLFGLAQHPRESDGELARLLGMKLSTVTAIRNRLKKRGYFWHVNMPSFRRLGSAVIVAGHVNLPARRHGNPDHAARVRSLVKEIPEIVFVTADPVKMVFMASSPRYGRIVEIEAICRREFGGDRGHGGGNGWARLAHFTPADSHILAFFNFGPFLAKTFGLADSGAFPVEEDGAPAELTEMEREILRALVRFPGDRDNAIARKIGRSRQSVARIRHQMEGSGLLQPMVLPDLRRLQFRLVVSMLVRVRRDETARCGRRLLRRLRPPLMLCGRSTYWMLYPLREIEEYASLLESVRQDDSVVSVDSALLCLKNAVYARNLECSPLLDRLLGT